MSYIAQSAAAPSIPATIMDQVVEPSHPRPGSGPRPRQAVSFPELRCPIPKIGARYPHQVSGGQLQRLMAAMALITDPELVVLDEPTTALDVTTQIEVLRAFKKVVRERGATAVYVSHDLAVVAQMADQILVLSDGYISNRRHRGILRAAHRTAPRSLCRGRAQPAATAPRRRAPLM